MLYPTPMILTENMLEVPWDEYVAYWGELQAKQPPQDLDGKAYETTETADAEPTGQQQECAELPMTNMSSWYP